MRTRIRVLIAVLGVVIATVALAAPAFAQTTGGSEPKYANKAAKDCAEKLADGTSTVDDCQKAPSPLTPEPNEVIWGSLAFLVLLVAMWKWGVPAVRNMERTREERIRNDLEAAEQTHQAADALKSDYERQIADSRAEAGRIIEEGRLAAETVRKDLISRAEADAEEIRQRAQADIANQQSQAMAQLRSEVAALSIDLAGRIVERNLDNDTNRQLVDSFIDQVGSNFVVADRTDAYAHALLEIARAEEQLGEVEDELFRFSRIIEGNDELRMALSNPGLPADRRAAIVDELLENRSLQLTRALAAFIVGAGRGHDFPDIVARFLELAAQPRQHEVAEVRSAVTLDAAQIENIATALSRATNKNIEVKVIVDPTVLGGLVATIGDTVIDGTVRHRLDQLKETI